MTEFKGRWERHTLIPASRRDPADRPAEPIYASLAAQWSRQGRAVPGVPDREWTALVTRSCWPRW
ncbi:hypothetical protein ACFXOS_03100 [Streptomyces sp. NPDC059175]|uniref:hypothetical protein n=1 Tax=Streptomyces sp. NPDC059175 TaxID=3346757 RepID=UPI003684228C